MGLTPQNYYLIGAALMTACAGWVLVSGRISSGGGSGIYRRDKNPFWYWVSVGIISAGAAGMWIGVIWPSYWLEP